MFDCILIANRGEIACRVIRTCRRLGIRTVAVYSTADADAQHVRLADEAWPIGGPRPAESYLRGDAIIEVALQTGAQAIHPGYGFLSENTDFARACAAAGIAFIGPRPESIDAMGSKAAAKALMETHAVPLVPGYHGADQDPERLAKEAANTGFPLMIKAASGGGGKGMRICRDAADFAEALASAQREAANAFGDTRVILERYVEHPRHIEFQVFGDTHGNLIHLNERECSAQRRYQKVLEETPSPFLDHARRERMGAAAVAAARAVDYVGAGTVEFIVAQDGEFFFMEMNTRLQVEHPVTEMVTGLDLVEWQLRVASGEPLQLTQTQLKLEGHAIEARIYAEHPARGFLPSTGTLKHLRMPEGVEFTIGSPGVPGSRAAVRIDSGVREGDTITPFYDPMIAKLIVHGATRAEALARMSRALRACEVVGPYTNVEFLQRIVNSEPFSSGDLDTGLIERHHAALFAPVKKPFREAVALACAALLTREGGTAHGASPWDALSHWRLNGGYTQTLAWRDVEDESAFAVTFARDGGVQTLEHDSQRDGFTWWSGTGAHEFGATIGDSHVTGRVFVDGDVFHVFCLGEALAFEWQNLLAHAADAEHGEGRLTAPMPGKVIAVLVEPGTVVEKGTPLIVMEAMKMEHTIGAPAAGTVSEVLYAVGDQVADGAQLLVLDVG
jgi:3-methylcrotonyl-CoA carboxylase alpha subunit